MLILNDKDSGSDKIFRNLGINFMGLKENRR